MKSLLHLSCYIVLCLVSVSSFANCDFVVLKESGIFESSTRAEQLDGIAIAPLCSDIPKDLVEKYYYKFCKNSSSKQHSVMYGAYSEKSFENCNVLVGSLWGIEYNAIIMPITHKVTKKDLVSESMIMLYYPDDFN